MTLEGRVLLRTAVIKSAVQSVSHPGSKPNKISIEFECARQSNKIEHGTFCEFDYVRFCSETEQN